MWTLPRSPVWSGEIHLTISCYRILPKNTNLTMSFPSLNLSLKFLITCGIEVLLSLPCWTESFMRARTVSALVHHLQNLVWSQALVRDSWSIELNWWDLCLLAQVSAHTELAIHTEQPWCFVYFTNVYSFYFCEALLNISFKFFCVQYSIVNYWHNIVRHISRTYSSYII